MQIELEEITNFLKQQNKDLDKKRNNIVQKIEKLIIDLDNFKYCKNGNENYLNEQINIIKKKTSAELIEIMQLIRYAI